ncbi:MAG: toll/interleukin-1 receptor domain-containing protein [Phycisphaerales bacterium]
MNQDYQAPASFVEIRIQALPEFATFDDLTQFIARSAVSESTLISNAQNKEGKTVFLSHSSKDKTYLAGVITVLENHGGRVYVDDGDSRLPATPCKETAAILRGTIRGMSRFVVFVTTNSKDSRWIPWELGLGDAYQTPSNVALFPTSKDPYEQKWAQQEYLGLYQHIVWGHMEGIEKACWMVYDHTQNTGVTLGRWLRHD